jgi:hypothetical protein
VEWDSSDGIKADPSLKSFLFTLKNPHDFPARKSAMEAERRDKAIFCASSTGPCFGDSGSCLGISYANDTGLDGETVLTGSTYFTVTEIEIFKIAD